MTVTPARQPATFQRCGECHASWTGFAAGRHYLGQISYSDGGATWAAVEA